VPPSLGLLQRLFFLNVTFLLAWKTLSFPFLAVGQFGDDVIHHCAPARAGITAYLLHEFDLAFGSLRRAPIACEEVKPSPSLDVLGI